MSERTGKKRVCSERRREKSRAAAQSRRGRESEMFTELALQLPLPHSTALHLDKASIVRLTLSYLRLRALLDTAGAGDRKADSEDRDTVPGASIEGFLLLISQSGHIVYTSEAVASHVGIHQMELIGQSVFEFIHPCDQDEMNEALNSKQEPSVVGRRRDCDFFLRMKCTLTNQGRTVNLKSASWKVLHCTGHLKLPCPSQTPYGTPKGCLVLLCEPVPVPSSSDCSLNPNTFLTRHSMDMSFTYCHPRVKDLLGYEEGELLGRSVYEFCHAVDTDHVRRTHHSLLSKGQSSTGLYRLLAKRGGYVWVQTDAAVIYDSRSGQPQSVICVNYILSGREESEVIFSLEQTESLLKPRPSVATATPDDAHLLFTELWEEPDELARLAPEPGDDIIALDFESSDRELERFDVLPVYWAPLGYGAERCGTQTSSPTPFRGYPNQGSCETSTESCKVTSFSDSEPPEENPHSQPVLLIEPMFEPREQNQDKSQEDLSKLDLETLAPYIPMDDEDFQLTPISEGAEEWGSGQGEVGEASCFTLPSLELREERYTAPTFQGTNLPKHPSFGGPLCPQVPPRSQQRGVLWPSDPPFSRAINGTPQRPNWLQQTPCSARTSTNITLQETRNTLEEYFHGNSCRVNGTLSLSNSLKRRPQSSVFQSSQSNTECTCEHLGEPIHWKRIKLPLRTNQNTACIPQTEGDACWWSSGQTPCHWQTDQRGTVPWGPWAGAATAGTADHCSATQPPDPTPWKPELSSCLLSSPADRSVLPVLTRWECEVNAPLTAASRLLHGSEILRVLDQLCPD
ncbi:hypoxia-inducible factor 1-alpha-like isoform X1 [Acipenser ruthenus]|uniref:hypoxia-inducible factor 1-alpha-like isoform X1 n=2 Tax=Acipenser ruthenus TaxID=7906 RepID=UPI0027428C22|nr:hypoxia-inducible factor 1-alpha-like isoform X1 [Acipenser ruthenus]